MRLTHALFDGNTFVTEVLPNALNTYPAQNLVLLPSDYWTAPYYWQGRTPIKDVAKIEAAIIAAIKNESERRKMALLTAGGAKKTEYSDKASEVRFFNSLGGTLNAIIAAINLMPAERRAVMFPYATADAAAFGDTIDKAIARFAGGIARSGSVPAIAAAEAKACAAVKAAQAIAGKQAVETAFMAGG